MDRHTEPKRHTLDSAMDSATDFGFFHEIDHLLDTVFTGGSNGELEDIATVFPEESYIRELQGIFRLAVKDHLRPVVTYVSYLLNGMSSYEAVDGLVNILPSLCEAAREVDMYDFADVLERMYSRVAPLQEIPEGEIEEEILRELALNLSSLPALLEMEKGDSLYRAMTIDPEFEQLSQTLHAVQTLNSETIHRLFRSGLTTMRALLTNRKQEIADVTGIEPTTVDTIVKAVKTSPMGMALVAKMRDQRQRLSVDDLQALEDRLQKAMRVREKIVAKLQRQRALMEQISRENNRLEAYFLSVSEKLRTLEAVEEELSAEDARLSTNELQQMRVRIRSLRSQIEQLLQQTSDQQSSRNLVMDKIGKLQKRFRKFLDAEEQTMAELNVDPKQLESLRQSFRAVKQNILQQGGNGK